MPLKEAPRENSDRHWPASRNIPIPLAGVFIIANKCNNIVRCASRQRASSLQNFSKQNFRVH